MRWHARRLTFGERRSWQVRPFVNFLLTHPWLANDGLITSFYSKQLICRTPNAQTEFVLPDELGFPTGRVALRVTERGALVRDGAQRFGRGDGLRVDAAAEELLREQLRLERESRRGRHLRAFWRGLVSLLPGGRGGPAGSPLCRGGGARGGQHVGGGVRRPRGAGGPRPRRLRSSSASWFLRSAVSGSPESTSSDALSSAASASCRP